MVGEDMIDVSEYTDRGFEYGDLMSNGLSVNKMRGIYMERSQNNEKRGTERDKER